MIPADMAYSGASQKKDRGRGKPDVVLFFKYTVYQGFDRADFHYAGLRPRYAGLHPRYAGLHSGCAGLHSGYAGVDFHRDEYLILNYKSKCYEE
jgi:hypothetical protein